MTAGGWIAEVRYNSTGRRVILILLAGSKASSLYSLAGMTGLIQVIDRHLQVFASHATTIVLAEGRLQEEIVIRVETESTYIKAHIQIISFSQLRVIA
jgi:hypothetical protein